MINLFKKKIVIDPINDGIWVINNLLSETDCAEIIDKIESIGVNKARQYDEGRKNKETFYIDEKVSKFLLSKFNGIILKDQNGKIKITDLSQPLEFYKYEQGDYIQKHSDAGRLMKSGKMSSITLVLYLNDYFQGGETFFEKNNVKIKPKIGNALLFKKELMHESLVIDYGTKYVLRSDCTI